MPGHPLLEHTGLADVHRGGADGVGSQHSATGGTLAWWGEWACVRTLDSAGELKTLRPDAYGELTLAQGHLAFYLEVDRGTTRAWQLGRKLVRYVHYVRYRMGRDAAAFAVLLVLRGPERATDVPRGQLMSPPPIAMRAGMHGAGLATFPLPPLSTHLQRADGHAIQPPAASSIAGTNMNGSVGQRRQQRCRCWPRQPSRAASTDFGHTQLIMLCWLKIYK